MTVAKLRELLEPLDGAMHIIIVGPVLDADGDETESWFAIREVTSEMDADTGEDYARFGCARLEDLLPHDA